MPLAMADWSRACAISSGLALLSSAMRASVGATSRATCGRVLSSTSACCTAVAKSWRSKLSRISQKAATLSRRDRSTADELRCRRLIVGGIGKLSQDAQRPRIHRVLCKRALRQSADFPPQLRIAGVGGQMFGGLALRPGCWLGCGLLWFAAGSLPGVARERGYAVARFATGRRGRLILAWMLQVELTVGNVEQRAGIGSQRKCDLGRCLGEVRHQTVHQHCQASAAPSPTTTAARRNTIELR